MTVGDGKRVKSGTNTWEGVFEFWVIRLLKVHTGDFTLEKKKLSCVIQLCGNQDPELFP